MATAIPAFRGVIFDMDGVVADTEPLHAQSWQAVLRHLGQAITLDWFDDWIGIADLDLAAHLADEHADDPEWPDAETLLLRKREAFHMLCAIQLQPAPGLRPFLNVFTGPRALCTSSFRSDVMRVLRVLELDDRFDSIVCGDEVPARKPDPAPYGIACAGIGLAPADCVVLEDSPHGVASAVAAGCPTLGILGSFDVEDLQDAGADWVFANTTAALVALRESI